MTHSFLIPFFEHQGHSEEHPHVCYDQLEGFLMEDVRGLSGPRHLKRFAELSTSQQNKRVKSFASNLGEKLAQLAKILLANEVVPRRFDFSLEGENYSVVFSHPHPKGSSTGLLALSDEEKNSVLMVKKSLFSPSSQTFPDNKKIR